MLSDCGFCYDTPCTCGNVYDDKYIKTETIFRIKQKLEEILFERQQKKLKKIE